MNNKTLSIIVYICIVSITTVAAFPDNALDGNGAGSNKWGRVSSPASLMKQSSFGVSSLSESQVVNVIEQWNKTFGGIGYDWANSVLEASDGGYIFVGGTTSYGSGDSDVWLVKTNASGSMQWNRTFGGWGFDKAYSVQMTTDNGYIIAGLTNSSGHGGFDALLIKTDASGNEQWNKTFGGANDDAAFSVQQTSDGGYILAGENWSNRVGYVDAWLIKTNANGDLQWSKTFGGTGYNTAASVRQTSDGGYILAGWTVPSGFGTSDALLIKTDANGNRQWSKTFGGPSEDWIESVKQTSEGGYILAGVFNSSTNDYAWLIKTDASGNQQWNRTFSGNYDSAAFDVNQTSDGYILTGGMKSSGAGNVDVYLVKTDKDGIQQWSQTFGGTDYDIAYSVQQTLDGGFILAGETISYETEYNDALLIKVLTPPSSLSVAINNGADYTNSTAVTLSISAVGATEMSFSNDSVNWSAWEPFGSQKQWTLPGGNGLKTVYFKANNSAGESAPVSDTIFLDTEPPTINSVVINDTMMKIGDGFFIEVNATDSQDQNLTMVAHFINGSKAEVYNEPLQQVEQGLYRLQDTITEDIPEGTFRLNISASDHANNIAYNESWDITIDDTKPEVTNLYSSILTPQMNEPVNITADLSDTYLDTASIFVEVKHPSGYTNRSLMIGNGTYYRIYTNTSEYGRYNVTIIAADLAGNVNNTERTWFVTRSSQYPSIFIRGGNMAVNGYGPIVWNRTNFPGLVIKETLNVTNVLDRTIPQSNLLYTTEAQPKVLKVVSEKFPNTTWTDPYSGARGAGLERAGPGEVFYNGSYYVLGWQGQPYVALNGKVDKLTQLIIEQGTLASEKKTLTVGETWDVGGGWAIKANSTDVKALPKQVWLTLYKDGVKKDDKVVAQGQIYTYVEKSIAGETDVPLFVTYVDSIFVGDTSDIVQLKYTWAISTSVTQINSSDTYGLFKDANVDNYLKTLSLKNSDLPVNLSQNSTINLMGDIFFKIIDNITDNASLEYYPFFASTSPTQVNATETADTGIEIITNSSESGTIELTKMKDIPPGMNRSFGLTQFGKYFEINASENIKQNLTWIKLKLYYTKSELDASHLDENSLKISWYNESADPQSWETLSTGSPEWVHGTGVEPADSGGYAGYVWANITHLSKFALIGNPAPTPTSTPPTSGGGGGSSSGSSGGGGGGGGTSGENYSNIEIKEKYDQYIFKDKVTSYAFTNKSNPILFINITGNINAGEVTAMIETLRSTSTLVKSAAPGIVYKNVNIWIGTSGFAVPKNIKEATIMFRIENLWLDSNNFASNDIKLIKWNGSKWIQLETSEKKRDNMYTYFEANTDSFSPYAIIGLKEEGVPVATQPGITPEVIGTDTSATTSKPSEEAPSNSLAIIGAIVLIAIVAVVYLKRKEIFKK